MWKLLPFVLVWLLTTDYAKAEYINFKLGVQIKFELNCLMY